MAAKKGRLRGSKDFTPEECCHFLRLALANPPVGAREWQQVADVHSQHPLYDRTGPSLQRKYTQLKISQPPTGDPNIPDHVELAYQLKAAISERLMIATGREEIDLDLEQDDEEDVNDEGVDEHLANENTANEKAPIKQTLTEQEGKQSVAEKEGDDISKSNSSHDKPEEGPLTSSSKKKKQRNSTTPIPSIINAPSVCSRRSTTPVLSQDLLQIALLQMQEEARRRDEDRRMREEERQLQIQQEERRREEDRRIREEERRMREEERREEARMRREEREQERRNRDEAREQERRNREEAQEQERRNRDEERRNREEERRSREEEDRRNRDQFMQMFLLAFGSNMTGKSDHSNPGASSNENNNS
jgi:hypothetical protein